MSASSISQRRRLVLAFVTVVGLALALLALPSPGSSPGAAQNGVPQFTVDPTWPKPLPNDWEVGQVGGIDVDQHDRIWIVQRNTDVPPVLAFDVEGNLLESWGGPGDGFDWPGTEHGIWVDHNDNVWIGGNGALDHQVLKFSADGEFLLQIGQAGLTAGSNNTMFLGNPADGHVDPEANEVYIADGYRNRRVIVYDADTGEYQRHWGAYGNMPIDVPLGDSQFANPVHCSVLSDDGLVYVCDRANNRVQVFEKDGTFLREFDVAPETGGNGAVWDVDFSVDELQSYLYVPDGQNQTLWVVDRASEEVLDSFGEPGFEPGQFDWVHNASTDSDGNIYTAEVNQGQRAQKFTLVAPGAPTVERLEGDDRIETAAAVSGHAFDSAEVVVLARENDYADALTGAPLAADADAPILLTFSDRLPETTEEEIDRLDAERAILLGGEQAISEAVALQLRARGLEVDRIGGDNRYDTAGLVADELQTTGTAFVVEGHHPDAGRAWPDALSAAPYAAFERQPVLLVARDRLPAETADALERLEVTEAVVVGGPGAVSDAVFDELSDAGHGPRRVDGADRYGTSTAVFDEAVEAGMDPSTVWMATGLNWPDALAAGPVVGARGDAFLLVHGRDLATSSATEQTLRDNRDDIATVQLLGGPAAISAEVEAQIRELLAATADEQAAGGQTTDAGLVLAGLVALPIAALLGRRRRTRP